MWLAPDTSSAALSRIQLDHQAFVDRGRQIGTCRKRLERALHFLCIDLDPFRETARFGRSNRALDAKLLFRLGRYFDGVARPHLVGRHVDALAVYEDAVMAHDLARLGAARAEPHAVRNGIQARLQQLQKTLARHAFAARGLCIGLAELALEQPVYAAQLLLLPQLLAEIGHTAAAFLSVLSRRIAAALDRAFVGEALLALEEELLPLAAALAALGIQISGHALPLYAPLFRRPAAVVGHGRHIRDAADLETQCIEGAHRRLSSGTRALDAHLEILYAALLCCAAGLLGRDLGGERRRFSRALEPGGARCRPRQSVALAIGNGDDGVVERGVNVGDAFGHVFFHFLANACCCGRCDRRFCHGRDPRLLSRPSGPQR